MWCGAVCYLGEAGDRVMVDADRHSLQSRRSEDLIGSPPSEFNSLGDRQTRRVNSTSLPLLREEERPANQPNLTR
jgi:hypothetical protein